MEEGTETPKPRGIRHALLVAVLTIRFIVERFFNWVGTTIGIMVREKDLFFGVILFLLGLLNFESGKYCDGNSGDYLSCTRPATFYYFDILDITLIVIGISLILVWFVKERMKKHG